VKVVGEVTSANRHDKFDYDYPYAMTLRIYDNIFLQHDTGYGHPENAKRLENTVKYLQASGLWDQLRVEKSRDRTISDFRKNNLKEILYN